PRSSSIPPSSLPPLLLPPLPSRVLPYPPLSFAPPPTLLSPPLTLAPAPRLSAFGSPAPPSSATSSSPPCSGSLSPLSRSSCCCFLPLCLAAASSPLSSLPLSSTCSAPPSPRFPPLPSLPPSISYMTCSCSLAPASLLCSPARTLSASLPAIPSNSPRPLPGGVSLSTAFLCFALHPSSYTPPSPSLLSLSSSSFAPPRTPPLSP